MNKIYRVVWNKATQTFAAVNEYAAAQGKSSRTGVVGKVARAIGARFAFGALMSGMLLASGQVMAATGTEFQSGADNTCYYDTDTNSVLCGNAVTTNGTNQNAVTVGRGAVAGGDNAVAQGYDATAGAGGAIAIGLRANHSTVGSSTGGNSIAIGVRTNAANAHAIAMGTQAKAEANGAISIGSASSAKPTATNSVAIGQAAEAVGQNSFAGGNDSHATGKSSVAVGDGAGKNGSGDSSTAVGTLAKSSGAGSTAVGMEANSSAPRSTALGATSTASGVSSVALGDSSNATLNNSVALGSSSVADVAAGITGVDPLNAGGSKNNSTWTSTHAAVSVGNGTTITRQITSVAAGTQDTDAVNVAQLKSLASAIDSKISTTPLTNAANGTVNNPIAGDEDKLVTAGNIANIINNSGFNLQANGDNASLVKTGDTVQFLSGDNIEIARNGNNITIATAKDLVLDSVTTGNTVMDNDGITITPAAGGNPVSLTADGLNNGGNHITNVQNNLPTTTNSTTNQAAPSPAPTGSNAATVDDVLNAGFNVQTNGAATDFVKPYDTLNFANGQNTTVRSETDGEKTTFYVDVNMPAAQTTSVSAGSGAVSVSASSSGSNTNYVVDLSPAAKSSLAKADTAVQNVISTSPNLNATKTGDVVTLNLSNTPTFNSVSVVNGPSMSANGINAADKPITNVADGTRPTDAVNLRQLDRVDDDANAGVSSAMAMASLPQVYLPGKSMLTGGIASYNGQGAVAIGLSKLSDNGRWVLKISGSADSQGNAGGAIGAGFHF